MVLDEAFIRSAAVHEPSAKERQLAAAEARNEPEPGAAGRAVEFGADRYDGLPLELRPHPAGLEDDRIYTDPWVGAGRRAVRWPGYGPRTGARGQVAQQRWHRPLAWVLVIVMGISLVAVAVASVYRGPAVPPHGVPRSAPAARPRRRRPPASGPSPAPRRARAPVSCPPAERPGAMSGSALGSVASGPSFRGCLRLYP